MKLSVIIVSYNVEAFLSQCLVSVERAIERVGKDQVEVFIVDNISVDGTCAMVKEKFPQYTLIENTENVGFSIANNQAIKIAKGEYVLLLNPDTVVQEDTFEKCIEYSDANPRLGGLGVPMFDGAGGYLPESKRGVPTPWASICRISGVFKLSPQSKKLNSYYAGHIDRDQTAQIEVLSGAFMWMRADALKEVGVLDEAFFMYGEDIDLSWRIVKGGWENHYFAGTRIIHYKGESTKKGSLNYVSVFYKAMLIFAAKHFEGSQAWLYNWLIRLAIYARASLSIIKRIVLRLALPVLETGALYLGLNYILDAYSSYSGIEYNIDQTSISLLLYSLIWLLFLWLFGGYDKPWIPRRVLKGVSMGTLVLFAVYGLMPEEARFSRAIVLFGPAVYLTIIATGRVIFGGWRFGKRPQNRLIVAGADEFEEISQLINSIEPEFEKSTCLSLELMPEDLNVLVDSVRVHKIGEVIFSGREVSSKDIISALGALTGTQVHSRIAWTEDGSLVGAGGPGPLTELDRAIYGAGSRRSKRLFDLSMSILILVLSPLLLMSGRAKWLVRACKVLFGKFTWVGIDLPEINKGTFAQPYFILATDNKDVRVKERLSLAYVKQYHPFEDLKLVLNSLLLQNEN